MPARVDDLLGEPDNLGCIYERQMKRMPDPSYSQLRQVEEIFLKIIPFLLEPQRTHWNTIR